MVDQVIDLPKGLHDASTLADLFAEVYTLNPLHQPLLPNAGVNCYHPKLTLSQLWVEGGGSGCSVKAT